MAKHKKDEVVKYRFFRNAKVVNPNPDKNGYIEIRTENGTNLVVPESDVKKPKGR
jgi:hypothetical protein